MTLKNEFDIYDAQCKTNYSLIQVGQAPPIPHPLPNLEGCIGIHKTICLMFNHQVQIYQSHEHIILFLWKMLK